MKELKACLIQGVFEIFVLLFRKDRKTRDAINVGLIYAIQNVLNLDLTTDFYRHRMNR